MGRETVPSVNGIHKKLVHATATHLFPAWQPSAHHRDLSWRPGVAAPVTAGRALRIDIIEHVH